MDILALAVTGLRYLDLMFVAHEFLQLDLRVDRTWVFDLWTKKWTQLSPSGIAPSQRGGSAAIYDGANDRMVIFGGNDGLVRNDVWAVANLSGTSTPVGPHATSLELRAFPNPFNPSTAIRYQIAAESLVTLKVYDILGREAAVLVHEKKGRGTHEVVFDGSGLPSGVYICRLIAGNSSRARTMILAK